MKGLLYLSFTIQSYVLLLLLLLHFKVSHCLENILSSIYFFINRCQLNGGIAEGKDTFQSKNKRTVVTILGKLT